MDLDHSHPQYSFHCTGLLDLDCIHPHVVYVYACSVWVCTCFVGKAVSAYLVYGLWTLDHMPVL